MALKTHSYGFKLQHDTDGVDPFTDVADVMSITSPECEADQSEKFGVSVPGVRESQWLENFKWGKPVLTQQAAETLLMGAGENRRPDGETF